MMEERRNGSEKSVQPKLIIRNDCIARRTSMRLLSRILFLFFDEFIDDHGTTSMNKRANWPNVVARNSLRYIMWLEYEKSMPIQPFKFHFSVFLSFDTALFTWPQFLGNQKQKCAVIHDIADARKLATTLTK